MIRNHMGLSLAGLCLALGACAVPPPYSPMGERTTQARVRVKVQNYHAYPALISVKAIDDIEPKEQILAIFNKGWMGMGATPKTPELIGMPETKAEANMPVLERYITGNRELRLTLQATLDGIYICGDGGAFTPAPGHDYELVVPIQTTSMGGNGQCRLFLYEIVPAGNSYDRRPVTLTALPSAKK